MSLESMGCLATAGLAEKPADGDTCRVHPSFNHEIVPWNAPAFGRNGKEVSGETRIVFDFHRQENETKFRDGHTCAEQRYHAQ